MGPNVTSDDGYGGSYDEYDRAATCWISITTTPPFLPRILRICLQAPFYYNENDAYSYKHPLTVSFKDACGPQDRSVYYGVTSI